MRGYRMARSKKFRNVARAGKAAFVVDERARRHNDAGYGRGDLVWRALIRVVPRRVVSRGIETHPYEFQGRTVGAAGEGGDGPDGG